MPYDPNKPAPNDLLSNSQLDIQSNFETANDVFDVNHYPFDNTSGNQGKHKFVQMPVGAIPAGLSASEATIYGKTANGASQLFYTNGNSGNEYQLTRANDLNFALFSTITNNYNASGVDFNGGWTFLPGGLLFQYGLVTGIAANSTKTVPFPLAFTTACYSVTLNPITSGNPTSQMIINANAGTANFVINNNSSTFTRAYWSAIGK